MFEYSWAFSPLVWHRRLGLENCLVIPNTFEPFLAHSGHLKERNGTEISILLSIVQASKGVLTWLPYGLLKQLFIMHSWFIL